MKGWFIRNYSDWLVFKGRKGFFVIYLINFYEGFVIKNLYILLY